MTKTESLLPEYEVKISTANWWLQVGVITFLVILGMTSKNYGQIESEIGARKFRAINPYPENDLLRIEFRVDFR